MKKNLFSIAVCLLMLFAIHTTTLAQSKNAEAPIRKSISGYWVDTAPEFSYTVAGNLNFVHTKAARDFVKRFQNTTNVIWFEAIDGYRAQFESTGKRIWVNYDKKGNWLNVMRTYQEKLLPKEIRHPIKSTYYDHTIKLVHEIELPGNSIYYFVLLESEKTLVELKMHDGEMIILNEWIKK